MKPFLARQKNGEPKQRGFWRGVRIHAVAAAFVLSVFMFTSPRTTLILGGTACFVTYLYLGLLEARKTSLSLSPLSFYFFWYTIGMGLSPLYLGLTIEDGEMVRFATERSMVSIEDLSVGYVLFVVGSLMLHFGMQLVRPRVSLQFKSQRIQWLLGWLGLMWAGGLLFQISPGSFSFLGGAAKILSLAVVGSVAAFAVTGPKRLGLSALQFVILLMIGTGGVFFGNLSSGSKAYIMFSFLPITWTFIVNRRLRLWSPLLGVVLGVFYFGLVAPVVYASRQHAIEEGVDPRQHLIESFDVWRRERPDELNQSFFAEQLNQFVNRQFDAVPVGFIVSEVNDSGILLGETMKYAAYGFVPRLVWPEKPTVTRGLWFSTYVGLSQTEGEATTSVGMTATGELYWNFGIVGVVVGMFVIGGLFGYLWRMAGVDPRGQPIHMLLYVVIMLTMPDMPEAGTILVSIGLALVVFKAAFGVFELITQRRMRFHSARPWGSRGGATVAVPEPYLIQLPTSAKPTQE